MGLFDRFKKDRVRVHVLIKGRIGEGWYDVDHTFTLAPGATLGGLIDESQKNGVNLQQAIDDSPHLKHTLMINGERCPVAENLGRPLVDGDEVYLLAPLMGG